MRELNREERDLFNVLSDRHGDWSVAHACIAHIRPFLTKDVHVTKVSDQVGRTRPEMTRAKKISWVYDVMPSPQRVLVTVELSDGATITITLEQVYFVKSATALAAWEKTMPKKEEAKWYVYVVRCNDDSLYCGTTTDVTRRVGEHNTSPKGAKYTRSRRPVRLVKSWPMRNRSEAVKAELRFKDLSKADKEAAVRNPRGSTSVDT